MGGALWRVDDREGRSVGGCGGGRARHNTLPAYPKGGGALASTRTPQRGGARAPLIRQPACGRLRRLASVQRDTPKEGGRPPAADEKVAHSSLTVHSGKSGYPGGFAGGGGLQRPPRGRIHLPSAVWKRAKRARRDAATQFTGHHGQGGPGVGGLLYTPAEKRSQRGRGVAGTRRRGGGGPIRRPAPCLAHPCRGTSLCFLSLFRACAVRR